MTFDKLSCEDTSINYFCEIANTEHYYTTDEVNIFKKENGKIVKQYLLSDLIHSIEEDNPEILEKNNKISIESITIPEPHDTTEIDMDDDLIGCIFDCD